MNQGVGRRWIGLTNIAAVGIAVVAGSTAAAVIDHRDNWRSVARGGEGTTADDLEVDGLGRSSKCCIRCRRIGRRTGRRTDRGSCLGRKTGLLACTGRDGGIAEKRRIRVIAIARCPGRTALAAERCTGACPVRNSRFVATFFAFNSLRGVRGGDSAVSESLRRGRDHPAM